MQSRFQASVCYAIFLLAGSPLALLAQESSAVSPQLREYEILVDQKPVGTYRMKIANKNGDFVMEARADVKATILFYNYIYQFRAREIWREDRLLSIDSRTIDDGQQIRLSARIQDQALHATFNGERRNLPLAQFTSSYWKLPESLLERNSQPRAVVVLDPDKGKTFQGKLAFLRERKITLPSGEHFALNYQLTGEIQAQLWFDRRGFLLRQTFEEQGHKTDIRLTSITEDQDPAATSSVSRISSSSGR